MALCQAPGIPAPMADVWNGFPTNPEREAALLKGIIHGMRCGVLVVDRDGRIVLINEPARRMLDLAETPLENTPVRSVFGSHHRLLDVLRDAFEVAHLPNRAEIELASGKTIGFTVSMVRDEEARASSAALFFKDLTQIEHREEQERLKDRLAALGEMAARLAHEIRNPLAGIEVSCKLLKRRLAPAAEECELLDKIVGEVRRLNTSLTSSLEYVRPIKPELRREQLADVLDESIAIASDRSARPSIRIECAMTAIPPFPLARDLLRQVFTNLVLNAIEAIGDESGTVTVQTELLRSPTGTSVPYRPSGSQTDGWQDFEQCAVVRIRDDGPGIPPDQIDRIFYPFFTTKGQGSGVGLAVVKKIVASHRGWIDVQSEIGVGTTFTVRLPMLPDQSEVEE